MAMPAKRGLIDYVQPDGEIIKIRITGDEHGHSTYSESGLLLFDNNGFMEYAAFDDNGFPISSGIIATKENEKSNAASSLQCMMQLNKWDDLVKANKAYRLECLRKTSIAPSHCTQSEAYNANQQGYSCDSPENEDVGRLVPLNFGRCNASFPAMGEQKGLVILVEYKDEKFHFADNDYFRRMLNEEGFSDYGSLGSVRDWFIENSSGKFIPEFDVYGPVELPNDRSYYGSNDAYGNDKNPQMMVVHACQLLDEDIDFSQYDRDGDGVIDNVFIFYAGIGEHDSNVTNAVWPHSWNMSSAMPGQDFIFDGVKLHHYACSCEYPNGYMRPDGIGTFIHEFSHVFGLPDLYATTNSVVFSPGEWDVLDYGPYNNDGLTPPNYSSFEKYALGWIDFLPFREGLIELPAFSESNVAYALPTENSNEFFFFENRQPIGNDKFLPGHGMIVWHVDYNKSVWDANEVNNVASHQRVDIIEADNIKNSSTRDGDVFPGTHNVTSLGFDTTPQLASWANKELAFDIHNISESEDGIISFITVADDNYGQGSVLSPCKESVSGHFYDLMGRKVSNPGKGIFILDGKKVIR